MVQLSDSMNAKVIFAFVVAAAALAATLALLHSRAPSASPEPQQPEVSLSSKPPDSPPQPKIPEALTVPRPVAPTSNVSAVAQTPAPVTNKLERLMRVREAFRALAAGEAIAALRAAKQLTNANERETALLTLVTEWTQGELSPPGQRADMIGLYGLEAGLGMELAKDPELALLWADELTAGPGRAALVAQTAIAMVGSDPAAAFALSDQLPQEERRKFLDAVFAGWAATDTDAALQWAGELSDPSERDAALLAIHSAAPVGIGAELRSQDGYPVVNRLLPGAAAELNGQIHAGDRILALAQGDNSFVDAHGLSLQDVVQLVRGAPGTLLQLQILPADAPPGSMPQTVSIIRDQIKFKR